MLMFRRRVTNIVALLAVLAIGYCWLVTEEILPPPCVTFISPPNPTTIPLTNLRNNGTICQAATSTLHSEPLSQMIFPVSNPVNDKISWIAENNKMLRALFRCIELDNCLPNQNKVVILGSYHFLGSLWGWNAGEDIWARSTINGLQELGCTFLYSKSMDQTIQLYQMFPDLVKAIFAEGDDISECWEDEDSCLLSENNPYGLPAWKLFAFHFWISPASPLGRNWTLSPEPYVIDGSPENLYLGYSVEPSCMSQAFIPHDDRSDEVYIMTKDIRNIADGYNPAWPTHFYQAATEATGIDFVLGASTSNAAKIPVPAGVTNHGLLDQKEFMEAVSRSLVLLGVGNPQTSPTPYEALCLGVPFINPIHSWDEKNPENRRAWNVQHMMLKYMDPPYVYNVFKDDLVGFVEAIEDAIANPIDRYVLERMKLSSIKDRLHALLETDWKTRAAELLESKQWTDKSFTL